MDIDLVLDNLVKLGIRVKDENGNFIEFKDIRREIILQWKFLSSNEKDLTIEYLEVLKGVEESRNRILEMM